MMNYEKLLSENLKSVSEGLGLSRNGYYNVNPYQSFQAVNKYPTPYQFPSSTGANYPVDDLMMSGNSQPYAPKYQMDSGYGHTAVETVASHYGPPMMPSKGGKLKGAALSALTLLAFLFFLNLLQSCLKDQMDAMNPTVMVMSAGQRGVYISRNDEDLRKADEKFTNLENTDIDEKIRDYQDDEYLELESQEMQSSGYSNSRQKKAKAKPKIKRRRNESIKRVQTAEPKSSHKMRSDDDDDHDES